jgi:hypothetical protein
MQYASLHHVSVWLDDLSSAGALTPAMDWARRLGLPLRVLASGRFGNHGPGRGKPANDSAQKDREPAPVNEKIEIWRLACAQRGIIMETSLWVGEPEVGINQFLRPGSLCVLAENRSDPVREKLLARSARNPEVLLLLTPAIYKPMTRVLVLHDRHDPSACFLETAARLCQALEVQPLILSLASSEREALLKQRFAEEVCSTLHLPADFDAVVDVDRPAAVHRIAAWRNCSHAIFERPNPGVGKSLWRSRRRDIFWDLRGVSDALTLLALTAGLALDFPHRRRDHGINSTTALPHTR